MRDLVGFLLFVVSLRARIVVPSFQIAAATTTRRRKVAAKSTKKWRFYNVALTRYTCAPSSSALHRKRMKLHWKLRGGWSMEEQLWICLERQSYRWWQTEADGRWHENVTCWKKKIFYLLQCWYSRTFTGRPWHRLLLKYYKKKWTEKYRLYKMNS